MPARAFGSPGHRSLPVMEWSLVHRRRHSMLPVAHAGHSQYHQGADHVAGVVRINGTPSRAQVFLHDRETGRLLARTWSGTNGEFRFNLVSPDRLYYAVAFDPASGEKAEIYDRI